MNTAHSKLLLPLGSLMELLGVITLITNNGMLISKVDLGFSVPLVLPVEVQGLGLLIAGGLITVFGVMNMSK